MQVASDKSAIVEELPKACADENAAVEFLEKARWEGGAACPHCGDMDVYQMKDRKTGERNKRYLWRCRGCNKQHTVRTGTVFEDSRIPLRHWCFAFWATCSSKKGVSALQIKRQTGLTYKSALFLMHRVRFAMEPEQPEPKLSGTVEVDETYVGGKPREKGTSKRGRGTSKTPVMALIERNGNARTVVPERVTAATLKGAIRQHVDCSSRIITDDFSSYHGIGKEFDGGHDIVKHSIGEYTRGDIYTNTAESFFSLLKRGIHGTFHHVSKKHLHRYVSEFEFRWNTRDLEDGARTVAAIKSSEGKRLFYKEPVADNS